MFVTDDDTILEQAKAVMSFSDMRPAEAGRDYHQYGLGYKYGNGNLPAAFALAGLRRLDETNAWAIENWQRLDDALTGTPYLVRSYSTPERPTNGYAYVLRVDPAYAKQRGVELSALTDGIATALQAEGTRFGRARWLCCPRTAFSRRKTPTAKARPGRITRGPRSTTRSASGRLPRTASTPASGASTCTARLIAPSKSTPSPLRSARFGKTWMPSP